MIPAAPALFLNLVILSNSQTVVPHAEPDPAGGDKGLDASWDCQLKEYRASRFARGEGVGRAVDGTCKL